MHLGSSKTGLALYGAVGLERLSGGFGTLVSRVGVSKAGGQRIAQSESVSFRDPDGHAVTLASHRRDEGEGYDQLRSWAPMNPYLASPRGRMALSSWDRSTPLPRPTHVEWTPVSILVDGQVTAFELCELDTGYWAAVGRLEDVDVTIDSRGVPLDKVELERLVDRRPPVPPIPDLAQNAEAVADDLARRFIEIPFARVRRWADYWAVRDIEIDHIRLVARRYGISDEDRDSLEAHWLARVDRELAETMESLHDRGVEPRPRSSIARHLRWNWLRQLWFNTFGPGAKTWFGNRHTTIRHYTFRLHWRP
jgi:hypothetical protein